MKWGTGQEKLSKWEVKGTEMGVRDVVDTLKRSYLVDWFLQRKRERGRSSIWSSNGCELTAIKNRFRRPTNPSRMNKKKSTPRHVRMHVECWRHVGLFTISKQASPVSCTFAYTVPLHPCLLKLYLIIFLFLPPTRCIIKSIKMFNVTQCQFYFDDCSHYGTLS